jgi:ribosomal peptide maturation radical SAM protein 1
MMNLFPCPAPSPNATDFKVAQPQKPPVALVYMPWGTISRGALGVSIISQCLKQRGFPADIYYFNIRLAEQIGIDLYAKIQGASAFFSEWFFAAPLFGKKGLGWIKNSWEELSGVEGEGIKKQILEMVDDSESLCREITEETVPRFIDHCVKMVDWSKYMVVGFSTSFAQTAASLFLAKRIKALHPHLSIVFGGANADSEMGFEILKGFDWVDYVVHGEAEDSFPRLLNAIVEGNHGDPLPGVSMRHGESLVPGYFNIERLKDLNESPVPDYSDYFRTIEQSGLQKKLRISLSFESSRGCWWGAKHHCAFCGLNGATMAFRKKTAERVYQDIMEISQTYRCLNLYAVDNILAMDYFRQLLPRLAETKLDLTLFYEVKANLTREQMKLLSLAGIKKIQPGIESLNTRLLRLMHKGVTAIQNIQLLKWCYEFGIDPSWNVLYGFPGEVPEDYSDFPRVFRLLNHLRAPSAITPVYFERFSPYHSEREKYSLTLKPLNHYRFIFPESRVDLEKMAYFFSGEWKGCQGDPSVYVEPVRQAAEEWRQHWKNKVIFCYYEKGPGFISIYDNRPLFGNTITVRKTFLNELQSQAYLFCDEHRSFKAIHEMLSNYVRKDLQPEQTHTLLSQLVNAGLMFQEEERYLALAVHCKSQPSAAEEHDSA